jgi:hypothetical protein
MSRKSNKYRFWVSNSHQLYLLYQQTKYCTALEWAPLSFIEFCVSLHYQLQHRSSQPPLTIVYCVLCFITLPITTPIITATSQNCRVSISSFLRELQILHRPRMGTLVVYWVLCFFTLPITTPIITATSQNCRVPISSFLRELTF